MNGIKKKKKKSKKPKVERKHAQLLKIKTFTPFIQFFLFEIKFDTNTLIF